MEITNRSILICHTHLVSKTQHFYQLQYVSTMGHSNLASQFQTELPRNINHFLELEALLHVFAK